MAGPLEGVRVVEFTGIGRGPVAPELARRRRGLPESPAYGPSSLISTGESLRTLSDLDFRIFVLAARGPLSGSDPRPSAT